MYLNRLPIRLIWAHHRSSLQSRQSPYLLKVKYRSHNYYQWIYLYTIIIPVTFLAKIIPSATPADQIIVPAASPCQRQEIALKQVSYPIFQTLHYQHSILSNLSSSFSRSKIPQIAFSPLLSTSLMMKAKKQAPLRQLESHR
jgi:hypothetical protein